ncbi:MAG: pseudouridine synthase [bacterium]|nr:pseudouridine synthase [bacterium]
MPMLRLHKAIATAGIASRRAAEEMIREGRVSVNGEIVTGMGVLVDPETDNVTVDGRPLSKGLKKRTYMVYKPSGVLCTRSDPQGRRTVYDLLPPEVSDGLHSAGRLDLDASGMIILTNDGDLSQALTHPSRQHHKTYFVRLKGEMDKRVLRKMRNGIELEDGTTLPADVSLVRTMSTDRETAVNLVLREGKNNQIKRMGDALGHRVISIKRTAIGRLQLPPKMKPGTYKRLTDKEIATLAGGPLDQARGRHGEAGTGRERPTRGRGDAETRGRGRKPDAGTRRKR